MDKNHRRMLTHYKMTLKTNNINKLNEFSKKILPLSLAT
ncbi:hypothetical protein PEC331060_40760 [Pectobacterium carotovorum subsp. carotovorum]|nr:hypothetical protein PEC331060_40760 [Pectobacterium carotovorum subsp. carotovorum]